MEPKSDQRPTLSETRRSPVDDGLKRICGIHIDEMGGLAAVWLTLDKDTDACHVYDAFKSEREVMVVNAEAIKKRGKWIPVAWNAGTEEIIEQLLDHGVNTIPKEYAVKDTQRATEAAALDVWERMRTQRFKVRGHLHEWIEEFNSFQRVEGIVPVESHPLMSATRHAIAALDWALVKPRNAKQDKPQVAIV